MLDEIIHSSIIYKAGFETICGQDGVFPDLDSDCEKYYVCNGPMVMKMMFLKKLLFFRFIRFGGTRAILAFSLMQRLGPVTGGSL